MKAYLTDMWTVKCEKTRSWLEGNFELENLWVFETDDEKKRAKRICTEFLCPMGCFWEYNLMGLISSVIHVLLNSSFYCLWNGFCAAGL